MQFSLAQVLLALPALTIAAAVPVNSTDIGGKSKTPFPPLLCTAKISPSTAAHVKRVPGDGPCHVNSKMRDQWVEAGMTRFRTTFSASGIDPGTYCQYWKDGTNIQCGWDPNVDGGWWRVDANFYRGPLGDAMYYHMLEVSRENWRKDNGCTTG
jgi:hypothetical protein